MPSVSRFLPFSCLQVDGGWPWYTKAGQVVHFVTVTDSIKGHDYYYLVESYRRDGKVKTRTLKYLGRDPLLAGQQQQASEPQSLDSVQLPLL